VSDATDGGDPAEPVLARARSDWGRMPERGSMAALRFLAWLHRTFGRRACLFVLRIASLYFALLAAPARRGSLAYLRTLAATAEGRRALGDALGGKPAREPGFAHVCRHIQEFAVNIFDRMVAWSGHLEEIEFEHRGSEVLFDLAAAGHGGFLVGAHQGSFDMMRLLADKYGMTVNVLMFTQHATRINEFFAQLSPASRVRVLEIQPGSLATAFAIRECIARGEFVGILADRIHPGARDRPVHVDFLGRSTAFALTPFVLATVLGCPVVHTQCIRIDDHTYESSARVLGQGLDPRMPRRKRAEALLREYAACLEATCLRAPFQWFNFFDYWGDREAGDA
jgi:predicted LPLAT superfamily acyltransferase